MSKYTTELRFICEYEAGLDESAGYNRTASVISEARPKIFSFDYRIFDTAYKPTLETKIIRHFYTREIAVESYGLWKLRLEAKMNEIMPYYNQLYRSALLEFNPLWTEDISTSHTRGTDGTSINVNDKQSDSTSSNVNVGDRNKLERENNTNVNASEGTIHTDETSRDRYADTPQGALSNVSNGRYLTTADQQTSNANSTENQTTENNGTNTEVKNELVNDLRNRSATNLDEYLEKIKGKRGVKSYPELLEEFRKSFLNIDMMIIDELKNLFFLLW